MAYSTLAEVQRAAGGREKLIQLTDQENSNKVDVEYVDSVIASADSEIDSYFQHRFAVPIADEDLTDVVRRMSAREAVYQLRQDRKANTEMDQAQHEERILWLEGVRRGEISPGIDPRPAESTSVVPATGDRETLPKFALTREKFEGWV